jgi:hypothetical protein
MTGFKAISKPELNYIKICQYTELILDLIRLYLWMKAIYKFTEVIDKSTRSI